VKAASQAARKSRPVTVGVGEFLAAYEDSVAVRKLVQRNDK
jgi:hypothetical protein